MNKAQKEVLKASLNNEKRTISELRQVYKKAKEDVEERIRQLSSRTDMENLQSIIYQKKYQEALKKQLDDVLDKLNTGQFDTISDYLNTCYETGYIGSMYDLQSQGIPMTVPINQKKVVKALQTDTKLSSRKYKGNPSKGRLAEDIDRLKVSIRTELSRSVANGSSWNEVAVKIAKGMNNPFDKAYRNALLIARTEGHRIQQTATLDAMYVATDKGANVVKQWDSTLDGKTRPAHREADGQIRELDEPFDVWGEKMDAPGLGGSAKNVCNCRCVLLQRAIWALDEAELKTLQERAEFFGLDKSQSFEDFKQKYLKISNEMAIDGDIQWKKKGKTISKEQYKELMKYASDKNIQLSGFKQYDGDIELIEEMIDNCRKIIDDFPLVVGGKKSITIELNEHLPSHDFAVTKGHIIHINANAFRDKEKLKEEYNKLVEVGWFVKGTDYTSIIRHEMGHVVANIYDVSPMCIAKEIIETNSKVKVLEYVGVNLSEYSGVRKDGSEIISECFSSVYGSKEKNDFALKFIEKCGILK